MTEATQQRLPTVTGFATRCAAVALRKHNVAIAPLLERAGISEHDFDNRQHRISAAAQSEFLERAAEALGDSAFGLHLAEAANPREAGLLFYVASAAKNLSEALGLAERYCRIVNEAMRLRQRRAPDGVVVEFNFVGLSRHRARQNVEFGLAVIAKALREVVGRSISPTRVTFAHARNSHLREFERFYRCPVEFAASSDQLSFSKETLALPLMTGDPYLLEALQPLCEEAGKERRTLPGSLRNSVENEVQKLLPHGKAERQAVAKALGMSTRTLSRRLADEDTTFDEVVDRLRQSLALQYIKERELSLSQIAWLIGYEGSTSLNHAFRRWTGHSPSAMRSEIPSRTSVASTSLVVSSVQSHTAAPWARGSAPTLRCSVSGVMWFRRRLRWRLPPCRAWCRSPNIRTIDLSRFWLPTRSRQPRPLPGPWLGLRQSGRRPWRWQTRVRPP